MSATRYTMVFFAPKDSTAGILKSLFEKLPSVAGSIGKYEHCAFVSRGTGQSLIVLLELMFLWEVTLLCWIGQFKPGAGAQPAIGSVGQIEYVEEDRIELVVIDKGEKVELKNTICELKAVDISQHQV